MTEQITYTGRNTREVRAFVDPGEGDGMPRQTWFVTRTQTAPTGGQAWRYVRANAADGSEWDDTVAAAVFDPAYGDWTPVRRGDIIRRAALGVGRRYYTVETP